MLFAAVVGQDPAEDLGVEGLDPSPEDLGKPGRPLDPLDLDSGGLEVRGRAAGRHDGDSPGRELAGELRDARLVVHREQGPAHRGDGGEETGSARP